MKLARPLFSCPTCGRPYPPMLAVSGPVRQRIVDIIARHPDGITRQDLMGLVYADDPNGGPEHPRIITVLINRANRQLAGQGYVIKPTWLGRGARYRLVPIA